MENLETEAALGTSHRTLTNKNHNKTKKISKTDQPRMDNPEMDILTRATGIYSMYFYIREVLKVSFRQWLLSFSHAF